MIGSLGIISIASGGTPTQITKNQTTPSQRLAASKVRIQAHPNNAAPVYVGLAGMEASPTGPNLLAVIAKPVSATTGPFDFCELGGVGAVPVTLNLADIYIDGSTSDGVIVSYVAN